MVRSYSRTCNDCASSLSRRQKGEVGEKPDAMSSAFKLFIHQVFGEPEFSAVCELVKNTKLSWETFYRAANSHLRPTFEEKPDLSTSFSKFLLPESARERRYMDTSGTRKILCRHIFPSRQPMKCLFPKDFGMIGI